MRLSLDRRQVLAGASAVGIGMPLTVAEARAPRDFSITLIGDCALINRVDRSDPQLRLLLPLLRGSLFTIGNLEGTLADEADWATAIEQDGKPYCGGLNIRGAPGVVDDLAWLGIDMLGTANNHALDFGTRGLAETLDKLDRAGLAHSGSGSDLGRARTAGIADRGGVKAAIVACASTYWPGAQASNGNASGPGRPGVNPLRIFGSGSDMHADPRDIDAVVASVSVARAKADLVVVSCHTHEGKDDEAPPFLIALAQACIDAGASAFFSHGPHTLRGVRVYKGRPIFLSLGSFLFTVRSERPIPEELYDGCDLAQHTPLAHFARISTDWDQIPGFYQSMIARVDFRNGMPFAARLFPIVIRHDRPEDWGMPAPAPAEIRRDILVGVRKLSQVLNPAIRFDADSGTILF